MVEAAVSRGNALARCWPNWLEFVLDESARTSARTRRSAYRRIDRKAASRICRSDGRIVQAENKSFNQNAFVAPILRRGRCFCLNDRWGR